MVKPWNAKPGKRWDPKLPDHLIEETRQQRANFDKNWDNIFGKKKLNNMEDNDVEEQERPSSNEAGET